MMGQVAVPCALMRGGTSKGLVFEAKDLPPDPGERDALLLAAMGSPDPRQIDGVGGAHPLTSKVAVVSRSAHHDADVEYLFLQVWPDRTEVSDSQNCGNMLAAVGPFALEQALLPATDGTTAVRIWMQNTQSMAIAHVPTPGGVPTYAGDARIDGVPGRHAPIFIDFLDVAGSTCGSLLPTGNAIDRIDGVRTVCVDNGMPVVCLAASDLDVTGHESPAELESDRELATRVEAIRLQAGALMNLGDVAAKSVPKVSLLAAPQNGGVVSTRTFIPHRVHEAIGVFGAVSVATSCLVHGSVAAELSGLGDADGVLELQIEHPSGYFTVRMDVTRQANGEVTVARSGLLRTARMLMRGEVLVPDRTAG